MASYNKITLVGNVGNDPQIKIVGDNRKVTELSLAINEKGRNGQPDKTEWYRVSLWDAKAEIAANYVRKGNPVFVEGRLSVRTFVDKEGKERYSLEVTANEIVLLGSKEDNVNSGMNNPTSNTQSFQPSQPPVAQNQASVPAAAPIPTPPALAKTGDEDDLPF
jgi:single-strand DNA-binding protein